MKTCIRCGLPKELGEYYAHPMMADGHLGKCKDCCKTEAKKRQLAKPEYIAEYDRRRFRDPARKAKVLVYARRRNARHPEKQIARQAINNGIRSGTVKKKPCLVCGDPKSQAHHADYSKPLEVKWLCFKHHRELEHGQVCHGKNSPESYNPGQETSAQG